MIHIMRSTIVAANAEIIIITMATLESTARHPYNTARATINVLMKGQAEIAPLYSTTKGTRTGPFCSIAMCAMVPTTMKSVIAHIDKSLDNLHTENDEICHFNKLLPIYDEILILQS
jgi:hypothetical protein